MPNHIHGILIINKPENTNPNDIQTGVTVETGHALFLQQSDPLPQQPDPIHKSTPKTIGQQRFQNIGKNSISSIIGSYKSAVSKHANRLGLKNGWQKKFHDHIIRDDADYQRISDYIINNPTNWVDDRFFT